MVMVKDGDGEYHSDKRIGAQACFTEDGEILHRLFVEFFCS